ncbi:MAG TPA: dihydrodipicolinate synthase family protein [Clostridiales bacterium]|jgi:4-hydroxy-2-oxoglutarate aldolase|nr:dihydrodipicolinate synthase family protein [Clostridiales bacterium]
MSYFEIKGVIPPVITPFKENDEVDYEKFSTNIKKWNSKDLAGVLVLGSNGETAYLREEEKLELIKLAVENTDDDKIVMVGTGLESTEMTIELTNKAAKLGADCALLLTPNYYGGKMGDEAQLAYFKEVADNTEIPILIYNVTKFTHINISPKVVSELSKHKNIIGMKDSSGDVKQLIQFMNAGLDQEFNLLVGTAAAWYPALAVGVKASVMALANCCPDECIEVQKLFEEGKNEESLELYKKMYPVNSAVTGGYGIAGLKYVCDELGFEGGFTRKPLLPLKDREKVELDSIIKKAELK